MPRFVLRSAFSRVAAVIIASASPPPRNSFLFFRGSCLIFGGHSELALKVGSCAVPAFGVAKKVLARSLELSSHTCTLAAAVNYLQCQPGHGLGYLSLGIARNGDPASPIIINRSVAKQ